MQRRVCACEMDLPAIRNALNISSKRFAEASYCNTDEIIRYEECILSADSQISNGSSEDFDTLVQECLWSDSS